jgi:hypothetical protein
MIFRILCFSIYLPNCEDVINRESLNLLYLHFRLFVAKQK